MHLKKVARMRRAKRSRRKFVETNTVRLSVNRSPKHIYAQVIAGDGSQVIATASSLEKSLNISNGGNKAAAAEIGKLIAQRAAEKGVTKVGFDRAGFKYHGRVQALADAARENGLQF